MRKYRKSLKSDFQLGNWSEKRGWNFDSRYANRWEFDIDPDSEDLEGLHLRVVVYLEEPFVIKTGDNQYEGFCIDLLNEMTKVLKFNYTIIEVQDGTYGIEVGCRGIVMKGCEILFIG